ncbi:MAG: 6-phosphogluconolactonase [Planctomycetota bacterium]
MPAIQCFGDEKQLYSALRAEIEGSVAPGDLLALPTGTTPRPLYRILRQDPAAGPLWSRLSYLQLDDYLDPPAGTELFSEGLARELFDPLGVPEEARLSIPRDGSGAEKARRMDDILARNGPIRLVLLGLGGNGHIAFNEPAKSFTRGYHEVTLAPETVAANLPASQGRTVRALTIGVDQILAAERVILAVPQAEKQPLLDQILASPESPHLPATALLPHPALTIFRMGPRRLPLQRQSTRSSVQ